MRPLTEWTISQTRNRIYDAPMHATPETSPVKPRRSNRARVLAVLCWFCLLAMIGLIAYLRTEGDRTGLATIMLFFPRWVFSLPALLLLPTARYRLCWVPLVLLVITAVFPLMGFCLGWDRLADRSVQGQPIRVLAFNLHRIPLSTPGFKEYLAEANPDLLLFEEITDRVDRQYLPAGLTHITRHGELCVVSRYPLNLTKMLQPEIMIRYTVDLPSGPLDLIGVHLSSPHWALKHSLLGSEGSEEELGRNISNRRWQAQRLLAELQSTSGRPLIIAGDFNLVPDSPVFTANLSSMGDAFESRGFGFGWTYFYQHAMVRIDHVLFNDHLICQSCQVGPNLGSPHHPVLAELVIKKQ
jgi:endonuclease/exonuclease/phosphatase (EEP) superfamily protein YafD